MPCTQWRNNKITNLVPSKYIIRNSFSINYEAIKDIPDIYTIQQHILWHIKPRSVLTNSNGNSFATGRHTQVKVEFTASELSHMHIYMYVYRQ